jgi:hypothetical protein
VGRKVRRSHLKEDMPNNWHPLRKELRQAKHLEKAVKLIIEAFFRTSSSLCPAAKALFVFAWHHSRTFLNREKSRYGTV